MNNNYSNSWQQALVNTKDILHIFALQNSFITDINTAFGANYNEFNLEQIQQQWQTNNFENFPEIEMRSAAEINGANGAYSADTNYIYLAQEFLSNNNSEAITKLLLEEYGHFIDRQINASDSPGDEGAIFSALVRGEEIGDDELQRLKNEDDSTVVILDGEETAIEQNEFIVESLFEATIARLFSNGVDLGEQVQFGGAGIAGSIFWGC